MERKKFIPQGKLVRLRTQNTVHHPPNWNDKTTKNFKIDSGDFPSLNDLPGKLNKNKTSATCQTPLSYSDKLKSSPQEPSIQLLKSTNFNDTSKNNEKINILPPKRENNCSVNDSQLNLSVDKVKTKVLKSFHSFDLKPNLQTDRSTSKSLPVGNTKSVPNSLSSKQVLNFHHTLEPKFKPSLKEESTPSNENSLSQKSEEKSDSPEPIDRTEQADDEGWTVCQRQSLPKKNQLQNKAIKTNSYEIGAKTNWRVDQASGAKCKYGRNNFQHKPTLSKNRDHETSRYVPNKATSLRSAQSIRSSKTKLEVPLNSSKSVDESRNIPFQANSTHQIHGSSGIQNQPQAKTQNPANSSQKASSLGNKGQPTKTTPSGMSKCKKKRKSQVKRLAALTANKLLIITPEAHTKILNQSSGFNTKSHSVAIHNLTDTEEYPELGMGAIPKNKKTSGNVTLDVGSKIELPVCSEEHEAKAENNENEPATSQLSVPKDNTKDTKVCDAVIKTGEVKEQPKLPINSHNRITMSLFDMLKTGKSKKKEPAEIIVEDPSPEDSPVKQKSHKATVQPVNAVSSKLVPKRGKEREQPKVKKPTKMRKLILMERQMKKERLSQKVDTNENYGRSDGENNEKSDIDNDILSDDSTLSPPLSPTGIVECVYRTPLPNLQKEDFYSNSRDVPSSMGSSPKKELFADEDFVENQEQNHNSFSIAQPSLLLESNKNINALEGDGLETISLNVCSDDSYYYEDTTVASKNESSSLDKDVFTTEDGNKIELQDCCVVFQSKNMFEESKCIEKDFKLQLVGGENSLLGRYFNDLVQSIIFDCMSEINVNFSEHFNKAIHEVTALSVPNSFETLNRDRLSLDYRCKSLEASESIDVPKKKHLSKEITDIQFVNTINDYCSKLTQLILDDSFLEVKLLVNKSYLYCDTTGNPNSETDVSLESDLQEVNNINLDVKIKAKNVHFSECELDLHGITVTNIDNSISSPTKNKVSAFEVCNPDTCKNDTCLEKFTFIQPGPTETKFTEKEKMEAVKILLHTRKFRDYCTHFPTKEIDETIFSLIDDLARFQDRLHQKDPVKARMKRRLMYGIKEIKKHLKLKKLKGIIVATDIEDNKAEGGLNDLLKEIFSLAAAYHIPYVFSHKRFNLGKVCRKPAPVSCVGIINYEGSEKNFKKMLELQEESKCDYITLTKKIAQDLTDNHIESLLETVHKSITPYDISKTILKELFGTDPTENDRTLVSQLADMRTESKVSKDVDGKYQVPKNENLKCIEKVSDIDVSRKYVGSENFDAKTCDTKDDMEKTKIHVLLSKYNVIKT